MGARPSHFAFTSAGPLRLYSTPELLRMPAPEWLIDGVIPQGGMIGLYGQPGTKKTFTALDMACSVGAGIPWMGRTVEQGLGIYVSAEGGRGIGKRVWAWCLDRGVEPAQVNVAWLTESIPVNVDSEEMAILLNRIVEEIQQAPKIVVIDTLARCFDGDENQQEDMGRFVAGVDYLRHELDTAVVIVHHTNLQGVRERGNTAFRGATDTMILVEADDKEITLTCTKQRDAEEFEPMDAELVGVEGTESAVMRGTERQSKREQRIQELLDQITAQGPQRWDDMLQQLQDAGIDKSTFYKFRSELVRRGLGKTPKGLWGIL